MVFTIVFRLITLSVPACNMTWDNTYFRSAIERIVIIACFGLISISAYTQYSDIDFQQLTPELGYQQVTCTYKDSYGFLWIGTADGLHKYNGTDVINYEKSSVDTTSISSNTINAICEDNNRNIWIGTSDGLNLYHREKDQFQRYPMLNEYSVFYINDLFVDSEGKIWICTMGNGLTSYNPKNSETYALRHHKDDPESLISNAVTCITQDESGNYWIGTRNGLDQFNPRSQTIKHYTHQENNSKSLSWNHITSLLIDKSQNLWIGTYGGGLNKVNINDKEFKFMSFKKNNHPDSLSHNHILTLCKDPYDNLWIGTENGGLNYFDRHNNKFIHYYAEQNIPNKLGCNSIWSIYIDDRNVLWIGTFNKGLYLHDKYFYKFNLVQHIPTSKNTLANNNVKAFSEDKNKGLWIATDGGGISYFNLINKQFENRFNNQKLKNKAVIDIMYDSHNYLWASIWNGGLLKLNQNGDIIQRYTIKSKVSRQANTICMLEDCYGDIWAGTVGDGLYKYNPELDLFENTSAPSKFIEMVQSPFIYCIFEDSRKNLWIGTLYGLYKMIRKDDGEFQMLSYKYDKNNKYSINNYRIRTLFEDSNGYLWAGTEDGLNKFDYRENRFYAYTKENGLPSNLINGILEDNNKNLWVSTNKGVAKFNLITEKVECYNQKDGLNSNMLNMQSCIKTSTQQLFYGGNNGFNYFIPDSIDTNPYIPPVYLTGIKLFNIPLKIGKESPLKKNISLTNEIHFNWKQNSFTIEYAALNYTLPSRNQYKYKLEGLDSDWIYVGNKHSATYTNLNPGTYSFLVKGSNNDGKWNNNPTKLKIIIAPPIWKTIWAYLLYTIIAGILLYSFIQLETLQAKQAEKLKIETLKREKEVEIHQLKTDFFANISHEIRTPLSLIISPLESIISQKKTPASIQKQLNMVFKNVKRMYELINELLMFTKSESLQLKPIIEKVDLIVFSRHVYSLFLNQAENRKINYEFISSSDSIEVWVDKNMMEKILSNLLSNAFKFTPDKGNIKLLVSHPQNIETSDSFIIEVMDNGMGIDPENINKVFARYFQCQGDDTSYYAGFGIGLALVKNLVELHHGTIKVRSEKWKSTCFCVQIPINKPHGEQMVYSNTKPQSYAENIPVTDFEISNEDVSKKSPFILLADDNKEFLEYLVSLLSETYNIITAENGEDAYHKALKQSPDLIITDVRMPVLNGIEFCKKIRSNVSTNHIPIIFLTSNIDVKNKLEGIETGADVYLTKPFNVEILLTTVRKTLENRKLLYQKYSQEVFSTLQQTEVNLIDKEFLQKIIDFVNGNIEDKDISVEKLASHMAMNRSNLYRKIKSLTGQTAIEFIRFIRLKRSIKYLKDGKYNISEVAMKVGFDSPGYFTKCFKAQFNKLPSELLPEK